MANQSGWNTGGRDFGGDYDGGRGRQREDYAARDRDGETSGYSRYDRRDDYRYGGGASADYSYGRNRPQGTATFDGGREYGSERGNAGGYGDRGYGDQGFGAYGQGSYGEDGYAQGYERGGYGRSTQGRTAYGRGGYGANAYESSAYGRSDYGRGGDGQEDRFGQGRGGYRAQEPRSFWDKTSDEVSSWFGDDEAARRRRQDEIRAGHHIGRGPSDYVRSDERIREDVNDRLTDDPHIDATGVTVQVKSGEVTLSGTVKSRNDKRHAEDLAESCSGVKHVQNNLRVHDSNYDAQLGQSGSSTAGATSGAASAASRTSN
jgi:osmotically-inducible protein OsmY